MYKRIDAVNLIQRRGGGGGGGAEEKEGRAGEKVGVRGGEGTSSTRKRSKRKEEEGVTFEVMITKIIIIFVYSQLFWPNGVESYIFSYLRIFLLG